MTQKDKKLNCLNCRIGDFKHSLCDCHNGFCAKYKGIGKQEDFFTAIETLSKPNYESDNEVRLAVTNREKEKVILWDAFGEVEYYPTTHGRLIDADALLDKLPKVYYGSMVHVLINDAPTVSPDRPHGEWIDKGDYAVCSECGGSSGTQFDGVEPVPRATAFCPHCGRRMKGAEHEID